MKHILALVALLSLAACAPEQDAPDRHPLGKADLTGSCAETDCDGQSDGACYCDPECVEFGDCCADKVEVCDAPVSHPCGGLADVVGCEADEYCHYEADQGCGFADGAGTCLPVPQICTKEFRPVCGCDGQTYSNSCHASASGTSVSSEGECPKQDPPGAACGGFAGLQCDAGEFCRYEATDSCGFADQTGTCTTIPQICTKEFAPVCGCDGNTYGNACHAEAAGTSVSSQGLCF